MRLHVFVAPLCPRLASKALVARRDVSRGIRSVTILSGAAVAGSIAGYGSLALGPVGWIGAFIVTGFVLVWLRRRPLAIGLYLTLLGATTIAILVPTVVGSQACAGTAFGEVTGSGTGSGTCYSPVTNIALGAYGLVFFAGLAVSIFVAAREFRDRIRGPREIGGESAPPPSRVANAR
jgi:hypothetical protein